VQPGLVGMLLGPSIAAAAAAGGSSAATARRAPNGSPSSVRGKAAEVSRSEARCHGAARNRTGAREAHG
jgi:hypothetical protein